MTYSVCSRDSSPELHTKGLGPDQRCWQLDVHKKLTRERWKSSLLHLSSCYKCWMSGVFTTWQEWLLSVKWSVYNQFTLKSTLTSFQLKGVLSCSELLGLQYFCQIQPDSSVKVSDGPHVISFLLFFHMWVNFHPESTAWSCDLSVWASHSPVCVYTATCRGWIQI